jgi:hypothetical protein
MFNTQVLLISKSAEMKKSGQSVLLTILALFAIGQSIHYDLIWICTFYLHITFFIYTSHFLFTHHIFYLHITFFIDHHHGSKTAAAEQAFLQVSCLHRIAQHGRSSIDK